MSSEIFYVVGHEMPHRGKMLFVGPDGYVSEAEKGRRFDTISDAYAKMGQEHLIGVWSDEKRENWKVYRIEIKVSEVVQQFQQVGSV